VFYKCDNLYNAASEGGIAYNDAQININWNSDSLPLLISEKDLRLPALRESKKVW
jgi:dTDP-4-dehydrorhamnose 3,5-epimerase